MKEHKNIGIQDKLWVEILTQIDMSGKNLLFFLSRVQYSLMMRNIVARIDSNKSNA
jgi:hypothetical protein